MPEFILPAEADHCPHCGAVLRDPPNCCETMEREHSDDMHRRYPATMQPDPWEEVERWEAENERERDRRASYYDDEPARHYYRD